MGRHVASRRHILIVEDDPVAAESLVDLLSHAGYATHVAADGNQALNILRRGPVPCLILLDLIFPDTDGWEFRRQQKQDPALASIPVVIITGAQETVERVLALDAAAYFTKPYDPDWLLETVRHYCG